MTHLNHRDGIFWKTLEGHIAPPPAALLLGWKLLEVDHDQGTIKLEFQAKPEFLNPIGVIHGGFLAAMLDETVGGAIAALLDAGKFAPTVELKVNFIRPAHVGPLVAQAHVVHRGLTVVFLQGELYTVEGQLIATASATAQVQTVKRTGQPPQ